MTDQDCYIALIESMIEYSNRTLAFHNMTMHGGRQGMEYFNRKVKEARQKVSDNCDINMNKLAEVYG